MARQTDLIFIFVGADLCVCPPINTIFQLRSCVDYRAHTQVRPYKCFLIFQQGSFSPC
jgi:hypothetical protein